VRLDVAVATDVGRVRQGSVNEDSYVVDTDGDLVAVADGMGGHRAGEIASATAVEALRAAVGSGQALRDAIESANAAVYGKSLSDERLHGMGTTVTAGTLAAGDTFIVGHVGDSRAYLLHDGTVRQVTTDHSLVEELVRQGRITREDAAVHPQRNVVTRALGTDPTVDVDVHVLEVRPGDRLLLCSDGLTSMVHEDEIVGVLRREPDAARAAQQLVERANAGGGEDNITVIVVDFVDEPATRVRPFSEPVVPVDTPEAAGASTRSVAGRSSAVGLVRIARWALPIVVVLGVAIGATAWYGRHSYFVGADGARVTVFRGVPGGFLGFDPTVERRTNLALDTLRPSDRADVRAEHRFASRGGALDYVARLRQRVATTPPATPPPLPTITTTTPPISAVPAASVADGPGR
jgi:protein phosphatase